MAGADTSAGTVALIPEKVTVAGLPLKVPADPSWDPRTMDFDKDVPLADKLDAGEIAATSTDLSAFKARGGKLISYHGWNDALIVQRSDVQTEPTAYGRDASAIWQLLQRVHGWDCIEVATEVARLARSSPARAVLRRCRR